MARKRDVLPAGTMKGPPGAGGRTWRLTLALLVAAFVVLAGAYNAVTPAPVGEQHNPDEAAHMLYVASVASGHLPIFHAGQTDYEAHQPPLYYALCAPVYRMTRSQSLADATQACRWVSILLGAALVVVTFWTIHALFPARPGLAVATTGVVALLPMNLSLSASVSNDPLADLVMAVGLWLLTDIVMRGENGDGRRIRRRAAWLGVTLGVGIWTKTSTLLLYPTVAVAYYLAARQSLMPASQALRAAAVSLGAGVLLGLPWLLRNQFLYGDPVAQHIFETAFQNTALAPDVARFVFHGSFGSYLWGVMRWTFASFWGVFDSMRLFWGQAPQGRTPSPAGPLPPLYDLLAFVSAVGLAGVARAAGLSSRQRLVLIAWGLLVMMTALAHFRFVLVFFQAQGRYWYPALMPLALLFSLGWSSWLRNRKMARIAAVLGGIALLGLNVYTLFGLLGPHFEKGSLPALSETFSLKFAEPSQRQHAKVSLQASTVLNDLLEANVAHAGTSGRKPNLARAGRG